MHGSVYWPKSSMRCLLWLLPTLVFETGSLIEPRPLWGDLQGVDKRQVLQEEPIFSPTNLTIFGKKEELSSLLKSILTSISFMCMCLSACMSEHDMHAWSPWRPDGIRSLELVLQKAVSHTVELEIEPGFSERGFSSLNQQAILLATNSIYWFISLFISFCLFLCFVLFETRLVD